MCGKTVALRIFFKTLIWYPLKVIHDGRDITRSYLSLAIHYLGRMSMWNQNDINNNCGNTLMFHGILSCNCQQNCSKLITRCDLNYYAFVFCSADSMIWCPILSWTSWSRTLLWCYYYKLDHRNFSSVLCLFLVLCSTGAFSNSMLVFYIINVNLAVSKK